MAVGSKLSPAKLPLPLSIETASRPSSNKLPLSLSRKLGESVVIIDTSRRMDGVVACFEVSNSPSDNIGLCHRNTIRGVSVSRCSDIDYAVVAHINHCHYLAARGFMPIATCNSTSSKLTHAIQNCLKNHWLNLTPIHNCDNVRVTSKVGYTACTQATTVSAYLLRNCDRAKTLKPFYVRTCSSASHTGKKISQCSHSRITKSVPVPCRFYPIPEIPPAPEIPLCRLRPPSNRLPLTLKRLRQRLPSNALPLPLTCWHDEPNKTIPNLPSYIMENIITATIGGIAVEPLSFNIKADMNGYCWSGNVTISDNDYKKIKPKLDAPKGSEPTITVIINGTSFSIIAEEFSRSRQFANYSYTLSGRSITARLGEDYALAQSGLLTQTNYASQIVNQQLANLLINVQDFDINDWRIPANQYAVTGKSPIAIIQEIAKACGGFVETHKSQPTLSMRKRWKVNAWDLATATPDVILPFEIPRQVSDKKEVKTRYNTATLVSDIEAGNVFRQTQSRDSAAPIVNNPLYTARECIIPAGEAIMSDSGIHQDYTITMMWSSKYNVELANLGEIWQFNDEDGAWRGVVQSVGVSCTLENNAPVVLQSVTVDRYLDV